MADSLLTALMGPSAQERLANDPFYVGGTALQRQQIAPTNNWEAVLIPALQGLASGGMQGYGRSNVASSMASNPLLDALKVDRSTLDTSDPFKVETALSQALLSNQLSQNQQQLDNEIKKSALTTLGSADPDAAVIIAKSILEGSKPGAQLKQQTSVAAPDESAFQKDADQSGMPQFLKSDPAPLATQEPQPSSAFIGNPNSPKYKAGKDQFDAERELANDFAKNASVSDFKYKQQNLNALMQAFKDPEGTSDFELLRRTTQMIEPGLAVRADDQASLQGAASLLGMSLQAVQSIANGQTKLAPEVRLGMMRIAQRAYDTSLPDYNKTRSAFVERAKAANLNPTAIAIFDEAKPFKDTFPDFNLGGGILEKKIPEGAQATDKTSGGKPVYIVNGKYWVPD